MQEPLHKEIRFAAIGTVILDGIVWLCSLPFLGLGIPVPLGLLLGSAGELCNLLLLRKSILNAVNYGKTRSFGGYLLRCGISGAAVTAGILLEWVSLPAVILPLFYPKILFGILSFQKER